MPILGLMSEDKLISPLASARIQRWALTLSNYQYHLRYKQGAQNTNADGLSRLPVPTPVKEVPVPAEVVLSLSVVNDTRSMPQEYQSGQHAIHYCRRWQITSDKAGHQTLLKNSLCSTDGEMNSLYSKVVSCGDLASSCMCLAVNVC